MTHTSQLNISLTGNIWQAELDKIITTPTGRPANPAIKLLNEIIGWHIPKKDGRKKFQGDAWSTNYDYLSNKLHVSHESIRRSLVFLERNGWIIRKIKHHMINNKFRPNILFIYLTEKSLELLYDLSSKNNPSPQKYGYINNTKKDNKINSYEKAKFEKNNLEKVKFEKSPTPNPNKFSKVMLDERLVLEEKDYDYLRMCSRRTFTDQGIDEILRDLVHKSQTGKIQAKEFYCKQAFLKFFTGWLAKEMRQEAKVNLVGFKIMPRRSKEEKEAEKYLNEVENRQDGFAETKFKKCIAGSFVNTKAYEILSKLGNINIASEKVKLEFTEYINLTGAERETIERLAREQFITEYVPKGESIGNLIANALIKNMDRELWLVEDDDTSGEHNKQDVTIVIPKEVRQQAYQPKVGEKTIEDEKWRAVYDKLILTYGEDIAKAWFAPHKIIGKFDDAKMEVTIEASTGFIRDWVDTHYGRTIDNIITNLYGKHDVTYAKQVDKI